MKLLIRPPIILDQRTNEVPEDFRDVMDYFNRGISTKKDHYYFMPRRTPITPEEIIKLWLPSSQTNLLFVAVDEETPINRRARVVGSLAVLYAPSSNQYEWKQLRKQGDLALTVDSDYNYLTVAEPLLRRALQELADRNSKARSITSIEFTEDISLMERLAPTAKQRRFSGHKPYQAIGLSGEALEWIIP